jgi:predicted HicB family RNase H-like nuclease
MIRASPELHRRVALEAARQGKSMNSWVQEILEKALPG